jgi:5'-AMP-activated protein kinase regulatory beta subunit
MPQAREVILVGDFNRWDPKVHPMRRDDNGVWRRTVMIQPGRYEYRYCADGQWFNDPGNAALCRNCFGSENNVIEVKAR